MIKLNTVQWQNKLQIYQPPTPRLIIADYQEIPLLFSQVVSTTPAVNYGRFMAFVTNVLILEPIVYCALFVKEDKTGTEES